MDHPCANVCWTDHSWTNRSCAGASTPGRLGVRLRGENANISRSVAYWLICPTRSPLTFASVVAFCQCVLKVSVFGFSALLGPSPTGSATTEPIFLSFAFSFRYNVTLRA